MFKKVSVLLLGTVLVLPACAEMQQAGQKETIGAVGGAVLGGYLGSKVGGGEGRLWATGAGALIGALMGSSVGRSLDQTDRMMMERTTQASLEHTKTGATSTWSNPDSGHGGSVTPTKTYQQASGTYCREYTQTVEIGGKAETATGTACRQPDGTWRIAN
jgi:surface antigen